MKKLILAVLITASNQVNATDLITGVACRHLDKEDHKYLNEINPSIGVEVNDIQVVYVSKNSWNHKSIYATYAPDYVVNKYVTLTANVGFATGYKCSNSLKIGDGNNYTTNSCNDIGVIPLAAATIDYSPFANNFAISLSINPSVAMFSLKYKIK